MKKIKLTATTFALFFLFQTGNAQIFNWISLENSKQVMHAGLGWDYGANLGLGYAYKISTKMPVLLNANFSIPAGKNILDDSKTKIGAHLVFSGKSKFIGSIVLNGLYRRYTNALVELQNIGTEIKASFGFYKTKWFMSLELGCDKPLISHFKHTELFKNNVYSSVLDGWYGPTQGATFCYGIQAAYSFKKYDITCNMGRLTAQDFKTTPLIPYYLMLGFNYRIR